MRKRKKSKAVKLLSQEDGTTGAGQEIWKVCVSVCVCVCVVEKDGEGTEGVCVCVCVCVCVVEKDGEGTGPPGTAHPACAQSLT